MPRETAPARVTLRQQVPRELGGWRLDQTAAHLFADYSRARLQIWIRRGLLLVDQRPGKVRDKVVGGEWLELCVEETPHSRV